jgi:hypothetical protein
MAWQFGIMLNNFAIYGERDLSTLVPFPGLPDPIPVKLAIYYATLYFTGVGQWLGAPEAPLNSWDELLMAYVNGTVAKPTFAVANSDAHNTLFLVDEDGDGQEGEDPIDGRDDDHDCRGDNSNGNRKPCDCLGGPGVDCDVGVDEDPPGHPLDSNVGLAKNGLFVKALTANEVYKAIKAGRSFATTGPSLAFTVNGKMMGSAVYIASGGSASLNLSATAETPGYVVAKMVIYKNGQYLTTIPGGGHTTLTDTVNADGYYRIEVTSVGLGLPQFAYSNPVFVEVEDE